MKEREGKSEKRKTEEESFRKRRRKEGEAAAVPSRPARHRPSPHRVTVESRNAREEREPMAEEGSPLLRRRRFGSGPRRGTTPLR
ncbi:uncharacterized protein DS421_18g627630 [Arachis hypogaea]|nr:uncharacterized protein DS421_18g627630 [Arachis hypogaea]